MYSVRLPTHLHRCLSLPLHRSRDHIKHLLSGGVPLARTAHTAYLGQYSADDVTDLVLGAIIYGSKTVFLNIHRLCPDGYWNRERIVDMIRHTIIHGRYDLMTPLWSRRFQGTWSWYPQTENTLFVQALYLRDFTAAEILLSWGLRIYSDVIDSLSVYFPDGTPINEDQLLTREEERSITVAHRKEFVDMLLPLVEKYGIDPNILLPLGHKTNVGEN